MNGFPSRFHNLLGKPFIILGIQPADVKVSLGLLELKVMHVKWILELCNHVCHQNEIIFNGFKAASIT